MVLYRFYIIVALIFTSLSLNAEYIKNYDTSISQAIKDKKIYPMGEKIFLKNCSKDIDLNKYSTIYELQTAIENSELCKPMKQKQFEALCIYLWEVAKVNETKDIYKKIEVQKDEKCPECGMFVYKYEKWAAQIFYKDKHFSFDGVKDLMKYYFKNRDDIEMILATDYYSQKTINAKKAFFVMGSDVYGPMGDELIPFENEKDAKTFYMDHKAKKIVKFQEITQTEVHKLDE